MSIRTAAYECAKSIVKSEGRQQVRNVLAELNTATSPGSPSDRSGFGYLARQQRQQFRGYMWLDSERARLESMPLGPHVPHLTNHEREALTVAHAELAGLNRACLQGVVSTHPELTSVLDPYPRSGGANSQDGSGVLLISTDLREMVATAFREHPGLEIILKFAEQPVDTGIADLHAAILQLDRELRSRHRETRDALQRVIITQPVGSPARVIVRYLAALASVRGSIAILDQMAYQATFQDRLPALDNNNIFNIAETHDAVLGELARVTFQWDGRIDFLDQGVLVLVRYQGPHHNINELSIVEGYSATISEEFGAAEDADLRLIDENLNPFARLLSAL